MMTSLEQLMDAIARNDPDGARDVLARDPSAANARGPAGESPLLAAIYRNAGEIIAMLAERRELDVFEATVLGDVTRVREHIDRDPALVAAYSADGWTALHLAAFYGQREIAELLLDRGAAIGATSRNYMSNMPLHAALAGKEDRATVELLLARGADVGARGATGVTPLHTAASRGNAALADLLLECGAAADARLDDGRTAAILARERGHAALAERLREREGSAS